MSSSLAAMHVSAATAASRTCLPLCCKRAPTAEAAAVGKCRDRRSADLRIRVLQSRGKRQGGGRITT
eukprot:CAMPEP_0179206290 /NCGR_PEP_ID=MMETSP0796-20121207/102860_1 /TAXON_ID=73915 /ORGANISM="Pyrodinium bahamense, Strain pbaha01" /LENGTH=66 /DNA_ID=CAMNT_0020911209 /DNA_START=229 /DNA_END=425 /DNA_ORIENTATION=-